MRLATCIKSPISVVSSSAPLMIMASIAKSFQPAYIVREYQRQQAAAHLLAKHNFTICPASMCTGFRSPAESSRMAPNPQTVHMFLINVRDCMCVLKSHYMLIAVTTESHSLERFHMIGGVALNFQEPLRFVTRLHVHIAIIHSESLSHHSFVESIVIDINNTRQPASGSCWLLQIVIIMILVVPSIWPVFQVYLPSFYEINIAFRVYFALQKGFEARQYYVSRRHSEMWSCMLLARRSEAVARVPILVRVAHRGWRPFLLFYLCI